MKKTFRRNQIVVSALAIMIAVAGYLTYAGKDGTDVSSSLYQTQEIAENGDTYVAKATESVTEETISNTEETTALQTETGSSSQTEAETAGETTSSSMPAETKSQALSDIESLDQDAADILKDPGDAVLTSGLTVADFMAEQKLNREQTRGINKEALLTIINNDAVTDAEKQNAIDNMVQLTQNSDKENAAESLLKTKGFQECIVSILDGKADVVICKNSLTDAERAQVEDIVKRKTDIGIENIVITLMETN